MNRIYKILRCVVCLKLMTQKRPFEPIQAAELRCAVFLAIESNENNELKVDESKLKRKPGYSMIYHFLRQNRFLATAAVFEKEMHQKIIPLEELKKENATTFCFQFVGDNITLSDSIPTETEQEMKESHSTIIRSSETNDNDSKFMSYLGKNNNNKESNAKTIERQQISHSESNTTLKSASSESEISRDGNETSNRYFHLPNFKEKFSISVILLFLRT
ncbi:unnamed protein product [Onchocerca flexuosa]|uniref:LisH domain-containing protein n=1 Tax=Onchocerca flexuosa TaxID=387005 RepID=A0A183HU28_9BILA|nr:unnamed protein product [Onchocerca flexuosa]